MGATAGEDGGVESEEQAERIVAGWWNEWRRGWSGCS